MDSVEDSGFRGRGFEPNLFVCVCVCLIQCFCPFQDYFSSYEISQSVDGVKTGEPQEKTPVSHVPVWDSNPHQTQR